MTDRTPTDPSPQNGPERDPLGDPGKDTTIIPTGSSPADKIKALGREVTLQTFDRFPGNRIPHGPITGREATLGAGSAPAATPLTGREATLGAGSAPETEPISGREATLGAGQAGGSGLSGSEDTLIGAPAPAGGPPTPTPATIARDAGAGPEPKGPPTPTPATSAGGGRAKGGTSMSFDDAWHLEGRKGPFTGQTWGDFDIGGILGEGGMGAVYRGKQRSLKRRVAVKVLPPNLAADFRLLQRFQLEARTSSMLSSPHVVAVYAVGEHDGNHFYAMEYVQGTDLYALLKERRDAGQRFGNDECVNYILQAAKGLAEAARHNVVHRDIKPPNLMVTKDGLLKITDFGIAKLLGEHNLTMTGQAVGTPAYVSPEQGRGDDGIDARSDLYSLGVVFYEMATLEKPFKGTTPNALIYQHCYEEPDLPKKLNPDVSDEVQAVIMRCLQKKAENRYQSAEELVRDLEAIRTGSMLKSALASYKLGTGAEEAKREQMNWFQRNLLPLTVAAGLAVAVGGGGGYFWLKRQSADELVRQTAAKEAELRQQKLRNELLPRLQELDQQKPIPAGIADVLRDYAAIAGENDESYLRWRRKVEDIAALEARLAVLDGAGASAHGVRAAARRDLASWQELVGSGESKGQAWARRLDALDAEERSLRETLGEQLDRERIDLTTRDDTATRLERLAAMATEDDADLARWRKALAEFDRKVKEWLAVLEPLGDRSRPVLDRQRPAYRAAIDALRQRRSADPRLAEWDDRLAQAGNLIDRLRGEVNALLDRDVVPDPDIKAAEIKIAQYRPLVEAGDSDLKRWADLIAASQTVIAAQRKSLADRLDALGKDGGEAVLPVPQVGPVRDQVAALGRLVAAGDADVVRWSNVVETSAAVHRQLAANLEILDPGRTDPITVAGQAALAKDLQRFAALAGVGFDRRQAMQGRLDGEQRRVAALRERLAAFDRVVPITQDMRSGLERLALDVGTDDGDVKRWRAKLDRVDQLRATLVKLDERQGIPERADQLFRRLEEEVGPEDPDLGRWRGIVERIIRLTQALEPLDRPSTPIPADAAAALGEFEQLAGTTDKVYLRRRQKFDEAAALRAALARLPATRVLSATGLEEAAGRIGRLVELVGASEADVRASAVRIQELAGPGRPAWASDAGRDDAGPWAILPVGGDGIRFRWIAPGSFIAGSPAGEPGRDADEVQVPIAISQGLWLAESECTQAQWAAMGGRPASRFAAPRRPAERVTWLEATEVIARLARASGAPLRLPTEMEWELAARAGSAAAWPDLADDPSAQRIAWTAANAGGASREVQQRYPNAHGLYDMHGNVWEWCQDGYVPYPTSAATDRVGLGGERKVARGGSWGDSPAAVRAANRLAADPGTRSAYLGFRLAADAGWTAAPDGAAWLVDRRIDVSAWEIPFVAGRLKLILERRKPEPAAPAPAPRLPAADPAAAPPAPAPAPAPADPVPPAPEPAVPAAATPAPADPAPMQTPAADRRSPQPAPAAAVDGVGPQPAGKASNPPARTWSKHRYPLPAAGGTVGAGTPPDPAEAPTGPAQPGSAGAADAPPAAAAGTATRSDGDAPRAAAPEPPPQTIPQEAGAAP